MLLQDWHQSKWSTKHVTTLPHVGGSKVWNTAVKSQETSTMQRLFLFGWMKMSYNLFNPIFLVG